MRCQHVSNPSLDLGAQNMYNNTSKSMLTTRRGMFEPTLSIIRNINLKRRKATNCCRNCCCWWLRWRSNYHQRWFVGLLLWQAKIKQTLSLKYQILRQISRSYEVYIHLIWPWYNIKINCYVLWLFSNCAYWCLFFMIIPWKFESSIPL